MAASESSGVKSQVFVSQDSHNLMKRENFCQISGVVLRCTLHCCGLRDQINHLRHDAVVGNGIAGLPLGPGVALVFVLFHLVVALTLGRIDHQVLGQCSCRHKTR